MPSTVGTSSCRNGEPSKVSKHESGVLQRVLEEPSRCLAEEGQTRGDALPRARGSSHYCNSLLGLARKGLQLHQQQGRGEKSGCLQSTLRHHMG